MTMRQNEIRSFEILSEPENTRVIQSEQRSIRDIQSTTATTVVVESNN